MKRTLPENWRMNDTLTAVVLAVSGMLLSYATVTAGIAFVGMEEWRWMMLSAVILSAPMAFYRRYPTVIACVVAVAYMVCTYTTGIETNTAQVSLYLSFYAVGAWENDRRRAFWVRVSVILTMAGWLLFETVRGFTSTDTQEQGVAAYFSFLFVQWMINLAFYGAGWFFGERAWISARERQKLIEAHEQIADQQKVIAQNAVEAERFRIARELHDTVAHHVTVMGVQAAATRRLAPEAAPEVVEQLHGVETSSRQAVDELKTMVHTLRDSTLDSGPLPGVAELDTLISQANTAGQEATWQMVQEPGESPLELTAAMELTIYRVVQEALSNARKHAGPTATIAVTVRQLAAGVEVDVLDNGWGTGSPRSALGGTGTGIVGMRERVGALGGTLQAGPTSRGGWLVRAVLPVQSQMNKETNGE